MANMANAGSKNIVFDIVGTCVSYSALIDALDRQLGSRLRAEGIKPSMFVSLWLETSEREYTFLSITNRYAAFDKTVSSLFWRVLWMSGIADPREFATEEDLAMVMEGCMKLQVRPDLKECFDKLRGAGFTVRGLTAGDKGVVWGYLHQGGIEMPEEHVMSCDAFGIGKPDLKAYASTYDELKGGSELWFAAAHMWDVSAAKQVGFKSAYCSVLEKEPCVDLFGEVDVMADSLSEMADKIIACSM